MNGYIKNEQIRPISHRENANFTHCENGTLATEPRVAKFERKGIENHNP